MNSISTLPYLGEFIFLLWLFYSTENATHKIFSSWQRIETKEQRNSFEVSRCFDSETSFMHELWSFFASDVTFWFQFFDLAQKLFRCSKLLGVNQVHHVPTLTSSHERSSATQKSWNSRMIHLKTKSYEKNDSEVIWQPDSQKTRRFKREENINTDRNYNNYILVYSLIIISGGSASK